MSDQTCGIPDACICGRCDKPLPEPKYVDPAIAMREEIKRLTAELAFEKRERIASAKAGDGWRKRIEQQADEIERLTAEHSEMVIHALTKISGVWRLCMRRHCHRCDAFERQHKFQAAIDAIQAQGDSDE